MISTICTNCRWMQRLGDVLDIIIWSPGIRNVCILNSLRKNWSSTNDLCHYVHVDNP